MFRWIGIGAVTVMNLCIITVALGQFGPPSPTAVEVTVRVVVVGQPGPPAPPGTGPPAPPPPERKAEVRRGSIVYALETDKAPYNLGDPVNTTFTITNTGPETVTFTFPTQQQYDFVIRSGDTEIARWSEGQTFVQSGFNLILAPGKSFVYNTRWLQKDSHNQAVTPGTYDVTATFLGTVQTGPQPLTLPGNAQPWGAQFNTPGVTLSLTEVKREKLADGTRVVYHLEDSGFPEGKAYLLWAWDFGEASPSIFDPSSVLTVDKSGRLVMPGGGQLLRQVDFDMVKFARGEPFRLAVISTDQTVKGYATAFPFPIEARDGRCHLWVELVATTGKAFAIHTEGFEPGEEVTTLSRSDGEELRETEKVQSDGSLEHIIYVAPAVVGRQSGIASFTVAAAACAPTVKYEWGPPAMKAQ